MGALKHRHTETQTPTHRRPTLHCKHRCGNNEEEIAQIASKRNFETFELRQLAKLSGQQRRLYSLTKKVRRRTHVIHIIPMGASCMLYLCQIYKFSVTFLFVLHVVLDFFNKIPIILNFLATFHTFRFDRVHF